jgi:hypothetical protein
MSPVPVTAIATARRRDERPARLDRVREHPGIGSVLEQDPDVAQLLSARVAAPTERVAVGASGTRPDAPRRGERRPPRKRIDNPADTRIGRGRDPQARVVGWCRPHLTADRHLRRAVLGGRLINLGASVWTWPDRPTRSDPEAPRLILPE